MKGKTVLIMALAAILALFAAYQWNAKRAPVTSAVSEGGVLFPGLDGNINNIEQIQVSDADGNQVVLTRGEQEWQVKQAGDYPAETGKVRKLLIGLAEATLAERKTADPQRLSALGLAESGDDSALTLTLSPAEGIGHNGTVLLGNSARGSTGTYVRRADDPQAWLATGDLSAQTDPLSWVDKQFLDFATNRIQRVVITHPDGHTVNISKATATDPNFFVADLPEGEELKYASVANPIAANLASLRMENVYPASERPTPEDAVKTVYSSFNGIVIEATSFEHDGGYYATFDSRFDEAQAKQFGDDPVEAEVADEMASDDATETPEVDMAGLRQEAQALAARLRGWVFSLSSYKYEQLTRRMDDLLKQPEAEAPAEP